MNTIRAVRQRRPEADIMNPIVSVVIPTYNRPESIRNCLDALALQMLSPDTFEVVVIDDGSPNPLTLDPGEWASAFLLRLVRQENSGPSGARNRGADAALTSTRQNSGSGIPGRWDKISGFIGRSSGPYLESCPATLRRCDYPSPDC